jgi:hypothetical protein
MHQSFKFFEIFYNFFFFKKKQSILKILIRFKRKFYRIIEIEKK